MKCVKIKEFEFRDNQTRYFYHKSLNTLFLDSSLTAIEKRCIVCALYIRLGILPPDNIYVSMQGGVFIKHFGSGNRLMTRYKPIR